MRKDTFPVVITGHIDHGKSTLIGRLLLESGSLPKEKLSEIRRLSRQLGKGTELAYITDQLKEEREKNLTIDTTQVFLKIKKRYYCVIDTPGHVEFLKNMISGATIAETAIIIIDAREGIMEQTRRHLYIINMLGIKQLIIVLNKMDLVGYSEKIFHELKNNLFSFIEKLDIKDTSILPVSAKENENISKSSKKLIWHKGPFLFKAFDLFKISSLARKKTFIFSVQDIYDTGNQKIIAGAVLSGKIKRNQNILILPGFMEGAIKNLMVFGEKNKKEAHAGENIGIVLKDALLVKRGDMISQRETPINPVDYFKGNIFWISQEPLRVNQTVTFRCSTQKTRCVVEKIEKKINSSTLELIEDNAKELKINEAAQINIRTEKPVIVARPSFIKELGKFVIEKEEKLQGFGIIID